MGTLATAPEEEMKVYREARYVKRLVGPFKERYVAESRALISKPVKM